MSKYQLWSRHYAVVLTTAARRPCELIEYVMSSRRAILFKIQFKYKIKSFIRV